MTTFILLLIIEAGSGVAMQTIPGYQTKAECVEAGRQFRAPDRIDIRKFICLRDPKS